MWRVAGSCLSWLSTVQPSMSGRNTSSETAVGWNSLRQVERLGAARRHQHLEALSRAQIDHHAGVVRVVLDDQQHAVARLRCPCRSSGTLLGGPLRRAARRERRAGVRLRPALTRLARPRRCVGPAYMVSGR